MEIDLINDSNNNGVIGTINFDEHIINVYGTELDPLFTVTDIVVKLL